MSRAVTRTGLAVIAVVSILAVGGCSTGASSSPSAVASSAGVPSMASLDPQGQGPTVDPHRLLRESIRSMLAGLKPQQVKNLCKGMKEDPNGTAEYFSRPLSATGVDPREAGTALIEELNILCHMSLEPLAPPSS